LVAVGGSVVLLAALLARRRPAAARRVIGWMAVVAGFVVLLLLSPWALWLASVAASDVADSRWYPVLMPLWLPALGCIAVAVGGGYALRRARRD
jgi:multisubunit Na+/H+ antiporter MnhB subunit